MNVSTKSTPFIPAEDARVLYTTTLVREAAASSGKAGALSAGMVPLQKRPMKWGVTSPATGAAPSGPLLQEVESMDRG